MPKHLYLLRHGKTAANSSGVFQGSTDLPLENPHDFTRISPKIKNINADYILTSPLLRARESANALGLCAEVYDDIQECDMGDWELLSWTEIAQKYPTEVTTMSEDYASFSFPHGESIAQFSRRIQNVAQHLDNHPAKKILLVTHGGVIRHLVCHYLGLPYHNYLLFAPENASLTTLEIYEGRGVLTGLGEIS